MKVQQKTVIRWVTICVLAGATSGSFTAAVASDLIYIDPGNSAKIIDWYGPFGRVCVAAVDMEGKPVTVHIHRQADGAYKDLANIVGSRWLDTGFHARYEVWVDNINPFPIYGYDCGGRPEPPTDGGGIVIGDF